MLIYARMLPLSRPPLVSSLSRWMRVACAVLALIGGHGLHEVLDAEDLHGPLAVQELSGEEEAHAGDCHHREHLHEPHTHACLACKLGHAHEHFFGASGARLAPATPSGQLATDARLAAAPEFLPGSLGARGPPLTAA